MSTFRQFTEGYYSASFSPRSGTARLFTDLLDELERQITMKIFDANRTLTSLNSELRRTVVIDGVHSSVFQEALEPRVGGTARTVTALDDLTSIVPPHSLVRKHPRGDFCLVLPLMVAKKTIQPGPLADLPVAAATPDFQCHEGEIFVVLRRAPFSPYFMEVFSPYPGDGPSIEREHYERVTIPAGGDDLVFPPDADAEVDLLGVMKGDAGAAADKSVLTKGDILICRGERFKVKAVTGGGTSQEIYGGRDLVVFDRPFPFNARKVNALRCPVVKVKAKRGFLPRSILEPFEPVTFKYSPYPQSKKFGSLKVSFTSLAFNMYLVCHRDSFLPVKAD